MGPTPPAYQGSAPRPAAPWWCLRFGSEGVDLKKLRQIARAHIEKAAAGDMQAIKELADRLDGRPAQILEHSGPDSEPITKIVNEIVHVHETREEILAAEEPVYLGLSHGGGGWRHVLCVPRAVCTDAGLQQPPSHQELGDPRSVPSRPVLPTPELLGQIRGEGDFRLIPACPVLPSWVAKG